MGLSRRDKLALEAAEGCSGHGDFRRGLCPFCIDRVGTDNPHRNWWVSQATGWYGCHRCAIKGRLPGFEDDDQYVPAPDAPGVSAELKAYVGPPDGFVSALVPSRAMAVAAKYLQTRGVTRSIAADAGIGACISGDLAGRVVIPVLGIDGKTWHGWVGRLYREAKGTWEPKYKNCPGMGRANTVYNVRSLVSTRLDPVICCEGAFDAIKYWPHCLAFLGKPGDGHAAILAATTRPISIVLDGDSWRESEVFARKLKRLGRRDVGWVRLEPKTDPNDIDPERLKKVCANSVIDGEAAY